MCTSTSVQEYTITPLAIRPRFWAGASFCPYTGHAFVMKTSEEIMIGREASAARRWKALRKLALAVGVQCRAEQDVGERSLHRLVGREELGRPAAGQLRPEPFGRLSQELAVNHRHDREDLRR